MILEEDLVYIPNDQQQLIGASIHLYSRIESALPNVPWFSNRGQQIAFYETCKLIKKEAKLSIVDNHARYAVYFWTLIFVTSNRTSFKLAIRAAQRAPYDPGIDVVGGAFLRWVNTNQHPLDGINNAMPLWKPGFSYQGI